MPAHRKSVRQKQLHGSRQPTTQRAVQGSNPNPQTPKRPNWLNAEARKIWKHLIQHLEQNDILQSVDAYTLAAFCVAASRWQSAERTIDAEGQFIKEPIITRSGAVTGHKRVKHPAVIVARQERESMLKFAALFGLDLKSRTSLDIPLSSDKKEQNVNPPWIEPSPEDDTELQEYLAGHQ